MKKILITACLLYFLVQSATAQGFDKGTIAIDLGTGLGLYTATSNDKANADNSNGAGAVLVPIKVEYGISKRFGIGLYGDPQAYISDPDSSDAASGFNIGIFTAFHFYNGKSSTAFARLGVGAGGLRYERTKDGVTNSVRGGGSNFFLGVGYKKYFGKFIGFFICMDYQASSLNRFEDDKGTLLKVNSPVENLTIGISGVNTTLGLTVKF